MSKTGQNILFFNLFVENFLKEKTEENKLIINNLNSSV